MVIRFRGKEICTPAIRFLGKKKDTVDNAETTDNNDVSGKEFTVKKSNNVERDKEEEKVSKYEKKKRYMYIALDSEGNAIIDQKGNVFTKVVEEGFAPEWDDVISAFSDMVFIDKNLSVEVPDTPSNLWNKDDKNKAKREIRENAKMKLLELAAERIERAKALATEKEAKKSEEKVQPEQKNIENNISVESSEKKTESINDESSSDSKKEDSGENKTYVVEEAKDNKETPVEKKQQKEDKPALTEKNDDVVVAIYVMGKQLNGDLNEAVEDLIGTMGKNVSTMENCVKDQAKRASETAVKAASDATQAIAQRVQKNAENVIGSVSDAKKTILETQDKIVSKVNAVGKGVNDMVESIESIEGNLHRLDQLDTIAEHLQNKGLTMSMEIPPVNADEEDIINLVRYSQKITEQLGYAARDLLRKQEAFKSQEEGNANEQKMMDQKITKALDDGVLEGKKFFVKQLISKYEDIDTIRESDNNHVHVIWTLLMELGVLVDGDGYYKKGKEIEFTDADIERLIGTYSKLDGAGKYRVVKTGLSFKGEIICKAVFEKINPDSNEDRPEEKVAKNEETQKEGEKLESNDNVESIDAPVQNDNE